MKKYLGLAAVIGALFVASQSFGLTALSTSGQSVSLDPNAPTTCANGLPSPCAVNSVSGHCFMKSGVLGCPTSITGNASDRCEDHLNQAGYPFYDSGYIGTNCR